MKPDRDFLTTPYPRVDETGNPPWLITFADLVSLMLVFFVMLFAMSTVENEQWQQILGRNPVPQVIETPEQLVQARALERAPVAAARDPDYLLSVFKTKLESDPLLKDLPLASYGDRIVLSIPAARLAADLEPGPTGRAGALVYALGGALQTLPNQIVVDGYAPDGVESGNRWATALRLAYRIASGLEEAGIEGPVLARGHVAAPGDLAGGGNSNGDSAGGVDIVLLDGTAPILAPAGSVPAGAAVP
jgi:chemotaxis protein MotB